MTKKYHFFPIVLCCLLICPVLIYPEVPEEENSIFTANIAVELGIDSLERRYYSPHFRYDWNFGKWGIFLDLKYYQIVAGDLSGTVDYWINFGGIKELSKHFSLEASLNHMCRHLTSTENPTIYDLNEVVARGWYRKENLKLGLGFGGFLGGRAGNNTLSVFNWHLDNLLNTELALDLELKWLDFSEILHEAELIFPLNHSMDLFIRNFRYYDSKLDTRIGMRISSKGGMKRFIHVVKNEFGVYPAFEDYKIHTEGTYGFEFFKTDHRRVLLTVHFDCPILRQRGFFGPSYPALFEYPISFLYERKIKDDFYLGWYTRYTITMPMDKDTRFRGDLGTGITIKNQQDFDMSEQVGRYELSVGYNFKHEVELYLKGGIHFFNSQGFQAGAEVNSHFNHNLAKHIFRIYGNISGRYTLKPFVAMESIEYRNGDKKNINRLLIGLGIYKWFIH